MEYHCTARKKRKKGRVFCGDQKLEERGLCEPIVVEPLEKTLWFCEEVFCPILIAMRSVIRPGCDICDSPMSASFFNILYTKDIPGLSRAFSWTQRSAILMNLTASSSEKFVSSTESTNCGRSFALYDSQACLISTRERDNDLSIIYQTLIGIVQNDLLLFFFFCFTFWTK